MSEIEIIQNLSNLWLDAVRSGQIFSIFLDSSRRNIVECGLRLLDGLPTYYARDAITKEEIPIAVEERQIKGSNFIIQFNGYRALRLSEEFYQTETNFGRPSDSSTCCFGCLFPRTQIPHNLSPLKNLPLGHIALPNWIWNIYFNVLLYEKMGHFVFVPTTDNGLNYSVPHFPQMLTRGFLEDMVFLFHNSRGMLIFYNSLHAGASVDHIHLQGICQQQPLAIESAEKASYKGIRFLNQYPVNGLVFDQDSDINEIWALIDCLQKKNLPFNLVFIGGKVYLLLRSHSHNKIGDYPMSSLGGLDLAGKIVVGNRQLYLQANLTLLQMVCHEITMPPEAVIILGREHSAFLVK